MEARKENIILFDGVCNFCNAFVQFTIKRDSKTKFKFASLQSKSGQALLTKFNLPTTDFNSLVYIKGENHFVRSSAVLNYVRELDGAWKLLYVFIVIPRPVRDYLYRKIANSRYRLWGSRQSCSLPTPKLKERFLA